MTTAYYSHPDCRAHDMGRGHPECPQRLAAIDDYLLASGLDLALTREEAPLVDLDDVARAHERGYVNELGDLLEQVEADGRMRAVDPDTIAGRGTWAAVLRAVALAMGIGSIISVLASIGPAYWASKKQPVDAMRVEE